MLSSRLRTSSQRSWRWRGDYEKALHVKFEADRAGGEWFDLTPVEDPADIVFKAVEELRRPDQQRTAQEAP
ncbi:hypothetical protein [Streptomyces sp. NPDC059874]|uniref:hypothetical protein n=1 Tax=Streptomyces sp. NPDC059874 TaxID=3346983 RepID=UPI00365156D9